MHKNLPPNDDKKIYPIGRLEFVYGLYFIQSNQCSIKLSKVFKSISERRCLEIFLSPSIFYSPISPCLLLVFQMYILFYRDLKG